MKALTSTVLIAVLFSMGLVAWAQEGEDESPKENTEDLKKKIARQEEAIEKLNKELKEAMEALKKLQSDTEGKTVPEGDTTADEPAMEDSRKKVEGSITEVGMDGKIVLLDIGKEEGVEENDFFEIYRGGKKIGKIKVYVVIDDNMSNAGVMESEVEPLSGDTVVWVGREKAEKPAPAEKEEPKKGVTEETGGEKGDLEKRVEVLEGLYADLVKQVERLQERIDSGIDAEAEKNVRRSAPVVSEPERLSRPAEVKATIVQTSGKHVFLGVGTDQGIKEGDVFIIKRDDREVATVRVTKLISDMCKAEIIEKNTEILKRDVAILR